MMNKARMTSSALFCKGVRSFELSLRLASSDLFLWFMDVALHVDFVT